MATENSDVAMGLQYIHKEVTPKRIHNDLKPVNILLNQNLRAKIWDFGKAQFLKDGASYVSPMPIWGTMGLQHMHRESNPLWIHNDLKPTNILLDLNLNAKVSDFKLVTIMKEDGSYDTLNPGGGTHGYMSLCQQHGWVGRSCDKFSYGRVLMELVTGQKVVDPTRPHRHLKESPV